VVAGASFAAKLARPEAIPRRDDRVAHDRTDPGARPDDPREAAAQVTAQKQRLIDLANASIL